MNLKDTADQLFFIVGCSRSGTSLLQIMISNHPDVMLPTETGFYCRIYSKYFGEWGELSESNNFNSALEMALGCFKHLEMDTDRVRNLCQLAQPSWETIFLAILTAFAEKHNVKRVGEKSPGHLRCMGLLKERFPKAKFIHIIRDPRAVVLSMRKKAQQFPWAWDAERKYIGRACQYWQDAIEIHRKYSELLSSQCYWVVKYEDLVTNPERTLRPICDFLNITFSPQMLEHHKRDFLGFRDLDSQPHMKNTLKPVFTSSIDKWREELSPQEIALIQYVLSDEMYLLGYEPIKVKAIFPGLRYGLDIIASKLTRLRRRIKSIQQR